MVSTNCPWTRGHDGHRFPFPLLQSITYRNRQEECHPSALVLQIQAPTWPRGLARPRLRRPSLDVHRWHVWRCVRFHGARLAVQGERWPSLLESGARRRASKRRWNHNCRVCGTCVRHPWPTPRDEPSDDIHRRGLNGKTFTLHGRWIPSKGWRRSTHR